MPATENTYRNRAVLGTFLLFLFLVLPLKNFAQQQIQRLPFRMANNLIILPARINGSDTLHFILDTGLKNSIICELAAGETLDLMDARECGVQVPGIGSPVEAILSGGNTLQIGDLSISKQNFVVLTNNILQLSHKMGTKIHGMLSMEAFADYIVEIDYEHRFISLIPTGLFDKKAYDGYASLPLNMESGKPILIIELRTRDGSSFPVRLLLDSGSSNALWLDARSLEKFSIPEDSRRCYLGCGISGEVQGMISRVQEVNFGPFQLKDVLVSYPDSIAIIQKLSVPGRNGSLGSEILRRFRIIIDIHGKEILLFPNNAYTQEFHYDMSGIEVVAQDPDLHIFRINRLREGSPAELAGVRTGDRILSINKIPATQFSLDGVYRNLYGKKGKKLSIVILRGEKKHEMRFKLEKYI